MLNAVYAVIEESFSWVTDFIIALGYWGIFFGMAVESANIPLPSELILPFGGYLVSTGRLTFWGAVFAGTLGGTAGSVFSYYLGYRGGRPLLIKYGRFIGITRNKLGAAERWFERYGEHTVFFTRLMPIVRTFISLPAGMAGMNFKKFVIYTFLGSLPWSMMLVYVGVKLGENWQLIKPWFHRLDVVVLLALLLLFAYWVSHRFRNR